MPKVKSKKRTKTEKVVVNKKREEKEAVSMKLSITYYVVIPLIIAFFLYGYYMYHNG